MAHIAHADEHRASLGARAAHRAAVGTISVSKICVRAALIRNGTPTRAECFLQPKLEPSAPQNSSVRCGHACTSFGIIELANPVDDEFGAGRRENLRGIKPRRSLVRQPDRRVLIIDGDLRCARLHTVMGAPSSPGLSDYLRGESRRDGHDPTRTGKESLLDSRRQ